MAKRVTSSKAPGSGETPEQETIPEATAAAELGQASPALGVAPMAAPPETGKAAGPTTGSDRASIPIDSTGFFDAGKAQDKTKQQLRKMFSDPKIREKLGIGPELNVESLVSDEQIAALYAGLGSLEIWAAGMMGFDKRLSIQVLTWSPAEIKAMTGPTKSLLQRYSSKWLREHAELVFWILMFSGITYKKFQILAAMSKTAGAAGAAGSTSEAAA